MSPFDVFNLSDTSLIKVILLSVLTFEVLINFIIVHCTKRIYNYRYKYIVRKVQ